MGLKTAHPHDLGSQVGQPGGVQKAQRTTIDAGVHVDMAFAEINRLEVHPDAVGERKRGDAQVFNGGLLLNAARGADGVVGKGLQFFLNGRGDFLLHDGVVYLAQQSGGYPACFCSAEHQLGAGRVKGVVERAAAGIRVLHYPGKACLKSAGVFFRGGHPGVF